MSRRRRELTYAEVGATDGPLPPGYHHALESRRIGHGRKAFEIAAAHLMSWGMHAGAGVRKIAGPDVASPGSAVTLSWHGMRFECLVVAVVDDTDRRGFTYGTLRRHPVRGEERFTVTFDPKTQDVEATITAFSHPAHPVVRLAGPLARSVQRRMTRRYLDALAAAVRSSGA